MSLSSADAFRSRWSRRYQARNRVTSCTLINESTGESFKGTLDRDTITVSSQGQDKLQPGHVIRTPAAHRLVTDEPSTDFGLSTFSAPRIAHFAKLYRHSDRQELELTLVKTGVPVCVHNGKLYTTERLRQGDILEIGTSLYHVQGTREENSFTDQLITVKQS